MEEPVLWCAGKMSQLTVLDGPQTAEPTLVLPDDAIVATERTADARRIFRWPRWQIERRARLGVNYFDLMSEFRRSFAETGDAEAECLGQ
jgi:hypothetical protein